MKAIAIFTLVICCIGVESLPGLIRLIGSGTFLNKNSKRCICGSILLKSTAIMGYSNVAVTLIVSVALSGVSAAPYDSNADAAELFLEIADLLQMEAKQAEEGPIGPTADSKFAQDVLKAHSMARADCKATNMLKMYWDQDLADLAAEHAEKCVYEHGTLDMPDGTRVGQNLATATWQPETWGEFPADKHVENWNIELKYFNNDTATCDEMGLCGHYSQVVWASTSKLGCAHKFCPNVKGGSDMIVCNYLPPGNHPGPAFAKGEPCSDCNLPGGTACVENQCVDCASDPEGAGNSLCRECDNTQCKDNYDNCAGILEDICNLQVYQSFVKAHCLKFCNMCACQ